MLITSYRINNLKLIKPQLKYSIELMDWKNIFQITKR